MKPGITHHEGIGVTQALQCGRNIMCGGHCGAVHQHRYQRYLVFERGLDLQAHRVIESVEPTSPLLGSDREPGRTDH